MKKITDKILAEKETIKKINLSETYSLTEIPEIIRQCTQLEKIDISFTDILEIPDFIFQFPKLKEINYLGCKKIKKQPRLFSSNQPIEKLGIYIGINQTVPSEIGNLQTLKSLTLSGELDEIPSFISNLTNLRELIIFNSKISSIPKWIENLNQLKKVSFYQALFAENDKPISLDLNEIFRNLSKCKNLKELNLDRNGIQEIPESIELLNQLQIFSAQYNLLEFYPNSIYNLTNLKELDLGVNQIKQVPEGIGKMIQLKTLKLNSNWKNSLETKYLFNEIDKLVNLETLELWSCQSIKEIPEKISNLKKLKNLDVDNNLLEKMPKSICSMDQLKTLRISTNKISSAEIDEIKRCLTTTKVIA